jgi:hypothetical protein
VTVAVIGVRDKKPANDIGHVGQGGSEPLPVLRGRSHDQNDSANAN